jgi:hypothetical protein
MENLKKTFNFSPELNKTQYKTNQRRPIFLQSQGTQDTVPDSEPEKMVSGFYIQQASSM